MLAQPQAVLQEVVQGLLDLRLRRQRGVGGQGGGGPKPVDQGRDLAQPRAAVLQVALERVGIIQDRAQGARAPGPAAFAPPHRKGDWRQHERDEKDIGHAGSLPNAVGAGNSRAPVRSDTRSGRCPTLARRGPRRTPAVDRGWVGTYHRAPMPAALPELVDPWRMVQARRMFTGTLPLSTLPRLRESLARGEGEVEYEVAFGTDDFGTASLTLKVDARLPLVCQRSLDVFELPVAVHQRLGLIASEADEAGLPEDCEPLLVVDSQLRLKDVIEDELILALPVVALAPGVPLEDVVLGAADAAETRAQGPFAALGTLKVSRH